MNACKLPGYCSKGLPAPRVLCQSYRSHKSSGLGYRDLTKLTEIPGTIRKCYRTHRFRGTGLNVVQNFQKFRVRV